MGKLDHRSERTQRLNREPVPEMVLELRRSWLKALDNGNTSNKGETGRKWVRNYSPRGAKVQCKATRESN